MNQRVPSEPWLQAVLDLIPSQDEEGVAPQIVECNKAAMGEGEEHTGEAEQAENVEDVQQTVKREPEAVLEAGVHEPHHTHRQQQAKVGNGALDSYPAAPLGVALEPSLHTAPKALATVEEAVTAGASAVTNTTAAVCTAGS